MTKKDFKFIADTLLTIRGRVWLSPDEYRGIVDSFTDALSRDNPRFNEDRFLKECGVENEN